MHTIITWTGLAAILITVLVALASPWLGRRSVEPPEGIIGRAVAFQALLGIVLLFAFPFAPTSSGHRATWFFVSGPATAILWLSALGHAVWFTWRKARGH
ncbi:MAG: hypothetical protein ABW216_05815 [Candidatus Rokuibacteriota bacterium]|nr:hypothetical protein [Patescibacteria group bacterium]